MNRFDKAFVKHHTLGFDRLADHIRQYTPEWAAGVTRVPAGIIRTVARLYADTSSACVQWRNALDMSRCNFQTARAVVFK